VFGPLEQRYAERVFELPHLPADGSWRHRKFVGGGRHAAEPAGGFEGAQSIQRG
jgi:hypothetical protein